MILRETLIDFICMECSDVLEYLPETCIDGCGDNFCDSCWAGHLKTCKYLSDEDRNECED